MTGTRASDKKEGTQEDKLNDSPLFGTKIVEPTRLFDNLFYVGYNGVGAFIINTAEGIIVIDAMWTTNDAKTVLVPGIKKLGLDPKQIKYLIITHEHADHYGGASYIEKSFGAKVLMSKVAWEGIHDPNAKVLTDPFGNKSSELELPNNYEELKDKDIITLGNVNIDVLLTPGHTKGTISLLIHTTNDTVPIVVSIWGGTGLPDTLQENKNYLNSLNYFESVAVDKKVQAQISNHPFVNNLLQHMEILRSKDTLAQNPLIISVEEFKENVDANLRKKVVKKIQSFN